MVQSDVQFLRKIIRGGGEQEGLCPENFLGFAF